MLYRFDFAAVSQISLIFVLQRDVFGDTSILGDPRWAGSYGIEADFIAGEQCSIGRISTADIQVVT